MSITIENRAKHLVITDTDNDGSLGVDKFASLCLPKTTIKLYLAKENGCIMIPIDNGKTITVNFDDVDNIESTDNADLFNTLVGYIES